MLDTFSAVEAFVLETVVCHVWVLLSCFRGTASELHAELSTQLANHNSYENVMKIFHGGPSIHRQPFTRGATDASFMQAYSTPTLLHLSNAHLQATFDLRFPGITSLLASYAGGAFTETLALPIRLEVEDDDGHVHASTDGAPADLQVIVHSNTSDLVNISIANIVDNVAAPLVTETWTVALNASSRRISLSIAGRALRKASLRAVRHGLYLRATSIHGLFSRGVVQMKGAPSGKDFLASIDAVSRVYAMGGGTAMDVRFEGAPARANRTTVLLSSNSGNPYWSGMQRVVIGNYRDYDTWDLGWSGKPSVAVDAGATWTDTVQIAPNDRNFPPPLDDAYALGPGDGARPADSDDLEAIHTAIFGSAVGVLCSYDNEVVQGKRVAQAATTIARPDRGYSGTYNYFDPDNYLTMHALLYSGEPYLQEQARLVIERSGAFLKTNGELPHHFEKVRRCWPRATTDDH